MKPKILIVDDEKPTRDVMARALGGTYECLTAPDAEQALRAVAENPDLALMISDVRMPGENGVELMKKAKAANPALACMLLTAYGTVDLAVEAMKDGADDFLTKPITDLDQLELRVAKAIKTSSLERQVADLRSQLDVKYGLEAFTGDSPAMRKVYELIRKVAPTDATVLIEGPSGSGKELTARALHNLSRRAKGPFVAVECASLPPSLLETELFGAVKGAYTGAYDRAGCFETADGGTIFLDEIGEINSEVQVKLLRVLETKTFQRVGESVDRRSDFRLVAATNKDLAKLVAEGKFREDLYYRLHVIDIQTPALKDHREDIATLVSRFIREFSSAGAAKVTGIEAKALHELERYSWPGNVRQLRNVIEKMCVLSSGGKLTLADVPAEITGTAPGETPFPRAQTLEETEKAKILSVLESCGGNKSRAAETLGISRRTLHRKINEWSRS
jgi:DNA-binding NtrC family response regulator